MRHFLLSLFLLGAAQAHADSTATNATELRDALRGTAQPAELHEVRPINGCGPNGCLVDIEPLRIWLERGRMEQVDGTPLRLREMGTDLPELDLSPLGAYRVSTGHVPGIQPQRHRQKRRAPTLEQPGAGAV